jgi:hypothetical protein
LLAARTPNLSKKKKEKQERYKITVVSNDIFDFK